MALATTDERRLTQIMYVGMALTAALMLAPIIDLLTTDSVSGHVRATYPHWPERMIRAEDRDAIVAWLAGVGLLGLATWYWSIRSVRRHSRRMRIVVTSGFSLGLIIAMINLTTGGRRLHAGGPAVVRCCCSCPGGRAPSPSSASGGVPPLHGVIAGVGEVGAASGPDHDRLVNGVGGTAGRTPG